LSHWTRKQSIGSIAATREDRREKDLMKQLQTQRKWQTSRKGNKGGVNELTSWGKGREKVLTRKGRAIKKRGGRDVLLKKRPKEGRIWAQFWGRKYGHLESLWGQAACSKKGISFASLEEEDEQRQATDKKVISVGRRGNIKRSPEILGDAGHGGDAQRARFTRRRRRGETTSFDFPGRSRERQRKRKRLQALTARDEEECQKRQS